MTRNTSYVTVRNLKELCSTLGVPAAEEPRIRMQVELVRAIRKAVAERGLTHAQTARVVGVGRTVITAVVNGNLDGISLDRLVNIACRLGLKPRVKVA